MNPLKMYAVEVYSTSLTNMSVLQIFWARVAKAAWNHQIG